MAKKFCRLQADDKKAIQFFYNETVTDEDGNSAELPWRSTVLQLSGAEKDQVDAMVVRARQQLNAEIAAAKAAQG